MHTYPLWLLIFFIVPLILLWTFFGRTLRQYAGIQALAVLGSLAISVPWDILSVRDHIWYFTQPQIIGWSLLGLPLEEYVYIACMALLCASVTVLLWDRYGKAE